MKSKLSLLLAVSIFGITATGLHAQVAINNSAANPDASAILDLKSGNAGVNKGFLPQAVALTNVTVAAPVTSPATGLIVYSSTAPAGGSGIGYYYWNGTAWASMGGGGVSGSGAANQVAFWSNPSTLSSDTLLYWNGSQLGIGTSHPYIKESIDINQSGTPNTAMFGGTQPVCFVANSPMVGFNAFWGAGQEEYYSNNYAGMIEFNQNEPGGFQFLTAPIGAALAPATMTPAMSILNSGFVGIGTAAPTMALQVGSSAFTSAEVDNSGANGTCLTGIATGTGNSWGIEGLSTSSAGVGVVAEANAASGSGVGTGLYASTAQSGGYGVQAYNYTSAAGDGVAIMGTGSGASGNAPGLGSNNPAIYGDGYNIGVYGYAEDVSNNIWPVYGANDGGVRWAAIAAYEGATDYKALGSGTVSTVVNDNNNVPRIMNCPEAPEILFEDYGSGTLVNGRVHIDLDPIYAKNITVNDKHALRVLITLNDQCNGVYVTNRTATGFDVVELNNGTSNAAFTYEVIANRADAYDANGNMISKNADNRFVVGPKPMLMNTTAKAAASHTKPATSAYVAPAAQVTTQNSDPASTHYQK